MPTLHGSSDNVSNVTTAFDGASADLSPPGGSDPAVRTRAAISRTDRAGNQYNRTIPVPCLDEAGWLDKKAAMLRSGLRMREGFPVFSLVELNLLAACNRRCPFCPAAHPEYYRRVYAGVEPRRLGLTLFRKILRDLQRIEYGGRVSFSGFSEPLLHPDWPDFLREARAMLPGVRTLLHTNGDLLDLEALRTLFASGLDELVVSLYDGPGQEARFEDMRRRVGLDGARVVLRRRYFDGTDWGMAISNRGGLVDAERFGGARVPLPRARRCYYPFSQLKIDFTGEVMFCPHNWARKSRVGNVGDRSLWDIWTGGAMEAVRDKLSRADRSLPACASCDVDGTRVGQESFEAWRATRST
jgi:MoaA/NifB/PqqE/SkfB family radical SAM enzyme